MRTNRSEHRQAAALSSYARQADDESLHRYADRIKARAIRRCGELLKLVEPARGANQNIRDGAGMKVTRQSAASDAGLSERQKVTALRVASVPIEDFEQQVESDSPPTITALAEQGTSHLGSSTVTQYRAATQARVAAQFSGRGTADQKERGGYFSSLAELLRLTHEAPPVNTAPTDDEPAKPSAAPTAAPVNDGAARRRRNAKPESHRIDSIKRMVAQGYNAAQIADELGHRKRTGDEYRAPCRDQNPRREDSESQCATGVESDRRGHRELLRRFVLGARNPHRVAFPLALVSI
jgi:hypothetical protein